MVWNILYTDGETTTYLSFLNRAQGERWQSHMHQIKDDMHTINKMDLTDAQRAQLYIIWLRLAEDMRVTYGNDAVPRDIKNAVHSVQDGLGLERTNYDG